MNRMIVLLWLTAFAVNGHAQKNSFHDQAFWKTNPDVAAIKAEIAKGSDPAQLTSSSFDATVYAINQNAPYESILFLLSQPGNEVNKMTHDSRTYLFWAASRGNLPVMEYLLKNGAKLDLKDSHGYSPLAFAVAGGQMNTKVYDLLIQHGLNLKKDQNHDGANPLLIGVANDKDLVLTNYFISKGLDLNSKDAAGNTAFNYVARTGNIELMKIWLQKGVKYTDNAMIMAAQGGRQGANSIAVFQFLESLKLNPAALGPNGENALAYIVRRPGQEEIMTYFISKGADVNQPDKDGNTPFMNAAASNSEVTVLEYLSSRLKNINQVNHKGQSALTLAVRSNSAAVVKWLLDHGAAVQVIDKDGNNLAAHLMQAYTTRNAETFEAKLNLLTAKGLNAGATQQNGNSLYHIAVAKNDLNLLKRVKELHVDINLKDREGYTALHRAVLIAKDTEILKQLISFGAKKELTTDFKETAYDLAKENEYLVKQHINTDFLKP